MNFAHLYVTVSKVKIDCYNVTALPLLEVGSTGKAAENDSATIIKSPDIAAYKENPVVAASAAHGRPAVQPGFGTRG